MPNLCSCTHKSFHGNNEEPTMEEVNVFRLWKCPSCGTWTSLLSGITDKSPQYSKIAKGIGFAKAYENIKWH